MSIWTHVNGSIRIDSFRFAEIEGHVKPENSPEDPSKYLGRIITYDDLVNGADIKDTFIPCGSEGSLEYVIYRNPHLNCLAAYTVAIFGDLRDYNNIEEILKYLFKICENKAIRSGIVEIEVEGHDPEIFRYVSEIGWGKI